VFRGWPESALEFFDEASGQASWHWADDRREQHDRDIREPMIELMDGLEDECGPAYVWHLHRDPYLWTHQVAEVAVAGRVGMRVVLSLDGLTVSGGFVRPSPQQLAAYRSAVAGPDGEALQHAVDHLCRAGWELGGDVLATRPRGTPADHPRLGLLRHRTLVLTREWEAGAWLGTPEPQRRVRTAWRALQPVTGWLADALNGAGPG
jgi:uncharacterized protein (DUF2461 family)